jgi:hypothetical protein
MDRISPDHYRIVAGAVERFGSARREVDIVRRPFGGLVERYLPSRISAPHEIAGTSAAGISAFCFVRAERRTLRCLCKLLPTVRTVVGEFQSRADISSASRPSWRA